MIYLIEDTTLIEIADSIRSKYGSEDKIKFKDFKDKIKNIPLIDNSISEFISNTDTVPNYAYQKRTNLTKVSFPSATNIGALSFSGCTNLTDIDMPLLTTVASQAFGSCTKLKSVYLPSVTNIQIYGFTSCTSLRELILPSLKSIATQAFLYCRALNTLVLGNSSVVSLANISAFTGTPFESGKAGGTVYVPQNLLSNYRVATNWSTLYKAGTCNFVAIEGSEYENII